MIKTINKIVMEYKITFSLILILSLLYICFTTICFFRSFHVYITFKNILKIPSLLLK